MLFIWYNLSETQVSHQTLASLKVRHGRFWGQKASKDGVWVRAIILLLSQTVIPGELFLHLVPLKAPDLHFTVWKVLLVKFNTILVFRGTIVTYTTSWEPQRIRKAHSEKKSGRPMTENRNESAVLCLSNHHVEFKSNEKECDEIHETTCRWYKKVWTYKGLSWWFHVEEKMN